MRLASIAQSLLLSATLFACANTATIPDESDGGYGEASVADDAAAADTGATCVDHCATNSDCQDSCPAVSGDVNCCDTSTGRCYLSAATSCPAPVPDAGSMPPVPYN